MPSQSSHERDATIEILRALAALAVAAFHFKLDFARAVPLASLPDLVRGAAGVDVFFVISGFVIARSAATTPSEHGAVYFAARRLIRIVPLYWSVTLLYLVLAAMLPDRGHTFTPELVLASLTFIPFPRSDGFMQPVIGQGWSLNYEMLFYLVFAGALTQSQRHAGRIAVAILTFIASLGLLRATQPQIVFWTSSIILEFAAGIMLAELHVCGFRFTRPLAAIGAATAIVFLLFAPIPVTENEVSRVFWLGGPSMLLVGSLALADRPLIPHWRWGIMLGAASYAMYLLHSLSNRAVIVAVLQLGLDADQLLVFCAALGVALTGTVAISVIVYIAFERPVMLWLQKGLANRCNESFMDPARTRSADKCRPDERLGGACDTTESRGA